MTLAPQFLMAEKPLPRPVQSSQQLSRDIIRDRIVLAGKLLLCCVENSHIVGIQRFSRKLRAEKEFLESVKPVVCYVCMLPTIQFYAAVR